MRKFCPVCAAVSSVWLIITIGLWLGFISGRGWEMAAAVAMGGSVVGIAFQRDSLRWKVAIISLGLPTAFLLVSRISALSIVIEIVLLAVFAYVLFVREGPLVRHQVSNTSELEEKLKNCC